MEKDKPTSKLSQFNEELNELLKKYQYTLLPKIRVAEDGIVPWVAIHDVIPPKETPKTKETKVVKALPVIEEANNGIAEGGKGVDVSSKVKK